VLTSRSAYSKVFLDWVKVEVHLFKKMSLQHGRVRMRRFVTASQTSDDEGALAKDSEALRFALFISNLIDEDAGESRFRTPTLCSAQRLRNGWNYWQPLIGEFQASPYHNQVRYFKLILIAG
jgi:hypothetical protein